MYFKNLSSSFIAIFSLVVKGDFKIINFLLALDRVGNALCGGHYRYTVSGRVGYFALKKANYYWRFLRWVIDNTFHPIEGADHCHRAYLYERGTKYQRGHDIALFFLSFVVIGACLLMAPAFYLARLFKAV